MGTTTCLNSFQSESSMRFTRLIKLSKQIQYLSTAQPYFKFQVLPTILFEAKRLFLAEAVEALLGFKLHLFYMK